MKNIFIAIVCILCTMTMYGQQTKKKVVMQTAIGKTVAEEVKIMFMDAVMVGLTQSNKYTILENRQIMVEKQTEEVAFQNEGWVKENQRVNLGNLEGAEIDCYAQIVFWNGNYQFTCRLTNISTGEIISAFSERTKNGDDDVFELCEKLTTSIKTGKTAITSKRNTAILCPRCCWDGSQFVDAYIYYQDEQATTWQGAVNKCREKGDGWYLPTKEELQMIYNKRHSIVTAGGDKFKSDEYWSSSQRNNYEAYVIDFSSGEADYFEKDYTKNCRCVKLGE